MRHELLAVNEFVSDLVPGLGDDNNEADNGVQQNGDLIRNAERQQSDGKAGQHFEEQESSGKPEQMVLPLARFGDLVD
ncbi:MAG: hypothetical protein ONB46_16260 [candidate division KSB1 bacterium]|nr:hypothetical protein [candidate division KSB1 bacterium]MDZ7367289.1 hypothetical protein [candidate division KSB1 bacterium]MDZ7405872.1 hypothetical protein [candidate division KSB1 bacterium]